MASELEISEIKTKENEEDKALQLCKQKIVEMNLPMEVFSAEFQW